MFEGRDFFDLCRGVELTEFSHPHIFSSRVIIHSSQSVSQQEGAWRPQDETQADHLWADARHRQSANDSGR